MRLTAITFLALAFAMPAHAQAESAPVTPTSVVAEAAPEEWVSIAPEDLLVMELAPDAEGKARRVVIQLIPPPFSQPWVENIRTLARAHWWDGTSVNRVQDNYVTQWGDVTEEKPLPEGVVAPVTSYTQTIDMGGDPVLAGALTDAFEAVTETRYYWSTGNLDQFPRGDSYADVTVHAYGWTLATSYDTDQIWPIHCYGYVGVGRGYAPDTGTGAELYTIIGQPQRHMDRNLAVVGRIIDGMQYLSSLPRGSGELGFYTEEEAHLRTPIVSVRLASELETPPSYEYLDTRSESFARYVTVRANRNDAFYTVPAGGVDICSVQVPVRPATS